MPLSSIVPGWTHELVAEAVAKVADGHSKETARLKGSRFALVIVRSEIDIDGLFETVEIGAGFASDALATSEAEFVVMARATDEIGKHRSEFHAWRFLANSSASSKIAGATHSTVIKVGDGTGFNSVYHHVYVMPLDLTNPLGLPFVQAFHRLDSELASHFMAAAG